jgi:hypothetical protein
MTHMTHRSMVPELLTIIANYKVMIYSGNLDIIVGAPLTEGFMSKLDFNGSVAFHAAPRVPYKEVGSQEVAGYVKHAGNLTQVVVRGAGHILPHDQPERVFLVCVPPAPLSVYLCQPLCPHPSVPEYASGDGRQALRGFEASALRGFCSQASAAYVLRLAFYVPSLRSLFSLLPYFPPSLSLTPSVASFSPPPLALRH